MSEKLPQRCIWCRLTPKEMLLCEFVDSLTEDQVANPRLPCNKRTRGIGLIPDVISPSLEFNANRGADKLGWSQGKNTRRLNDSSSFEKRNI